MHFGGPSVRVHLEADGVSSGEGFSCWARHFPAGILSVFQGKMTRHSAERPAVWRVGGFQIHPELNTVAVRVFRNAARRPTVAAAGRFFLFLLPSSIPVPALRPFVDAHGVGFASVRWLLLQRRGILLRRVSSLEMGVKFSRYRATFR